MEEEWRDMTSVGSNYEEQVSRKGNWRHRRLALQSYFNRGRLFSKNRGFLRDDDMFLVSEEPWIDGRAPVRGEDSK